ncbi:MAG: hypothetical protein NZZ41_05310 [Candidatus Dojkabacteria bacterium]|nr:hypothetical protein [Candidatus Dojkabacteria bacterium]
MLIKFLNKFAIYTICFVLIFVIYLSNIRLKVLSQSSVSNNNSTNVGYGIIINKIKEEYKIVPGSYVEDSFEVIHDYDTPNLSIKLYPIAEDVEIEEGTGHPVFLGPNNKEISITNFIEFKKEFLFLQKRGDKEKVDFKISIPKNTPYGSYYGAIVLSEQDPRIDNNATQIGIQGRISMLVIITIVGDDIRQDISIEKVVIKDIYGNSGIFGTNLFFHQPLYFEIWIKNNGNTYVVPGGNFFIYTDNINKAIFTTDLNITNKGIANNISRIFSIEWNESFFRMKKDEKGSIYPFVDISQINKIHIGKFNATVKALIHNQATKELELEEETISFFLIPYPLLIGISVTIIVLFIVWYKWIKKKNNKKIKIILQ